MKIKFNFYLGFIKKKKKIIKTVWILLYSGEQAMLLVVPVLFSHLKAVHYILQSQTFQEPESKRKKAA